MTRNIGTDPQKYDLVRHGNFRDIVTRVTEHSVFVVTFDGDQLQGHSDYPRHEIANLCSWQAWCKTRDNKE